MNTDETLLAQILTRSYPVTPQKLIPLAERIREIEGVFVTVDFQTPAKRNSDYSPGRYDYERAASGKMNVNKWLEKRFQPRFPLLKARITTTQGRPLLGEELLSYAKGKCNTTSGFELRFNIESKKETSDEKAADLKNIDKLFSSFPIFDTRDLIDKPNKFFLIKWHTNKLILQTKPICLSEYELAAVEEILSQIITHLNCKVTVVNVYNVEENLPLKRMFTSQDLNSLIPRKQEAFTKKLLALPTKK